MKRKGHLPALCHWCVRLVMRGGVKHKWHGETLTHHRKCWKDLVAYWRNPQ
jgi:hypothetical protein